MKCVVAVAPLSKDHCRRPKMRKCERSLRKPSSLQEWGLTRRQELAIATAYLYKLKNRRSTQSIVLVETCSLTFNVVQIFVEHWTIYYNYIYIL